jgi:CubicO group peptidase (beta-lactamase class C family)
MLHTTLLWTKRILVVLFITLGLGVVLLLVTGNGHIFRGLSKTYLIGKPNADIDDMPLFDVSQIPADMPQPWPLSASLNQRAPNQRQSHLLDSLETTAFLVFKSDSLLFEQYWRDGSRETVSNSFSMAKSFTSMMIGKAIDEGYIKSVDQPVGDFIEEFKSGANASLTIKHLLTMTSGIPFGEDYSNPFGFMAKVYFGTDIESTTLEYEVEKTPGSFWVYEGGNTILLGMIIKRSTGRTPSEYFFQKFWSCVGAEHTAHWNLECPKGMEKTFSGFYATARDYARIGKLMMHDGIWGKDTLLSPRYVEESFIPCQVPDKKQEACYWYGYQWWVGEHKGVQFQCARGMLGQYIIMIPEAEMVVVRLGHKQSKDRIRHMTVDLYDYIDAAYEIAQLK